MIKREAKAKVPMVGLKEMLQIPMNILAFKTRSSQASRGGDARGLDNALWGHGKPRRSRDALACESFFFWIT